MKVISLIPLLGALALQGSGAGSVRVWKSADIRAKAQLLTKKMDANKLASEVVAKDGNRSFLVAYREASGESEVHDTETDIMFIIDGEVTMVYGGTIVGGKISAPGQTRGSGISGGTEVMLGAGDVLHIPATVPHQMKLAPGAKVTYVVTKVVQ
jgi:mannose-6-phosphate isomerase-like protein (cupin superfamily)